MVSIGKKYLDIRIFVDFINLNQASDKDNYHISLMEQTLRLISSSQCFSLLDGFYEYN
jgi:hypothetical protein